MRQSLIAHEIGHAASLLLDGTIRRAYVMQCEDGSGETRWREWLSDADNRRSAVSAVLAGFVFESIGNCPTPDALTARSLCEEIAENPRLLRLAVNSRHVSKQDLSRLGPDPVAALAEHPSDAATGIFVASRLFRFRRQLALFDPSREHLLLDEFSLAHLLSKGVLPPVGSGAEWLAGAVVADLAMEH